MASGILVGGIEPYRKGDTITLTDPYAYGLYYYAGTEHRLVLNYPLDRPVAASGFTVTLGDTTAQVAGINGLFTFSSMSVSASSIKLGQAELQFSVRGSTSAAPTSYSPIMVQLMNTVITFT